MKSIKQEIYWEVRSKISWKIYSKIRSKIYSEIDSKIYWKIYSEIYSNIYSEIVSKIDSDFNKEEGIFWQMDKQKNDKKNVGIGTGIDKHGLPIVVTPEMIGALLNIAKQTPPPSK